MGRGFREVAKDITSALNLGEDEGKIDALAASLHNAANESFGHESDLKTKLISSLNQSSLSQSNRVKNFLDGERGGGTFITGELSPLQQEVLEQSMSTAERKLVETATGSTRRDARRARTRDRDLRHGMVDGLRKI